MADEPAWLKNRNCPLTTPMQCSHCETQVGIGETRCPNCQAWTFTAPTRSDVLKKVFGMGLLFFFVGSWLMVTVLPEWLGQLLALPLLIGIWWWGRNRYRELPTTTIFIPKGMSHGQFDPL